MDRSDIYVIESDMKEDTSAVQTVSRIYGVNEELWDYGGVFYTNCFRVSKPIMLTSLGFFGPFGLEPPRRRSEEHAAYVVHVEIEELRHKFPKCHVKSVRVPVRVSSTEPIFYVNFPSPAKILSNVWYDIRFRIEGPDTLRGLQPLDHVISSDGVSFDFFQGSLQMPQLRYTRRI